MKRTLLYVLALTSLLGLTSTNAIAGEAWQDLKQLVFKDRIITESQGTITIKAPYRTPDDRRVPISVHAKLEPGRTIKAVTVIIDENPMPVSATFTLHKKRSDFAFSTFLRFNGPSPMRVVIEADNGELYMSEKYVKTSGLGACASPPVGNPDELLAGLGNMELTDKPINDTTRRASQIRRDAHLKIKHPNLTGLQMDQITLQYILARYVETVEVSQGEEKLFSLQGSISLSENPELTFDYLYNGANELNVHLVDTNSTKFTQSFKINIGS